MKRILIWLLLWCCPMSAVASQAIWLLDLKGAIGVASAEYVESGIAKAHAEQGQLIILRIDTPGGLDLAMRQIIQRILSSDIPLACFVAPQGARAASAGTYILYACHFAAMSPATTLGAATPVQLAGASPALSPAENDKPADSNISAMQRKVINDATAFIKGLAQLRGRNSDWAELAVRQGVSLPAEQALQQQVINFIANDVSDLLAQLDGRMIGQQQLALSDAPVITYQANWRHQFLSVLTNPNVAYILMLLGIYGLFFEFSNPGMAVPGITGALCLLLALYAFQVLPVNYAGLAIILLGLALLVAEAIAPSFGVLGIGGIIALVIGSVILFDSPYPEFQLALPVIAAVAVCSAGFTFFVVGMLLQNRRNPLVSGTTTLLGKRAQIEHFEQQHPMIHLEGEWWQVAAAQPLQVGDWVQVQAIDGLVLQVTKSKEPSHD
ncbi:nodulation protein NfeD [Arsukibacterium sp.]|uniref:NfeD family protein n=1 Tax=Arsukibacterium sp. TaxID=1977258 RepID=UPI00356376F9